MKDIVLVGFPNAGKSFVAEYLKNKYGFEIIEIGKYVNKEAEIRHISSYECANVFFAKNQYFHFVKQAINDRWKYPEKNYVLVGPRTVQELNCLEALLCKPILIAVVADVVTRQTRAKARIGRECDLPLIQRDEIEGRWGLAKAIDYCPYILENESTDDLEKVERIVNSLII